MTKITHFQQNGNQAISPISIASLRRNDLAQFYSIYDGNWSRYDALKSFLSFHSVATEQVGAGPLHTEANSTMDTNGLGVNIFRNDQGLSGDQATEFSGVGSLDIRFKDTYFQSTGSGSKSSGGGSTGGSLLKTYDTTTKAGRYAGYDIVIDFKGTGWTTGLQSAFTNFADYLTTQISNDIGGNATINGRFIDDLYITAQLVTIDGAGGILGQAGATSVWNSSSLTATGQMQFDSADAKNYSNLGLWDDIVAHEMMHVLGFGSLWEYNRDLVSVDNKYTGAAGLAAYNALNPTNQVSGLAVETGGGAGTAGSHWAENVFGSELMTGYINNQNTLSQYSVMSLNDLGYQISSSSYQTFVV